MHIECPEGEAKYWIEPVIALASYYKLNSKELKEIQKVIETRENEIIKEWKKHFSQR